MRVQGEKLDVDKGVSIILAGLFGAVMGISMWAVLAGDYLQPGAVMNEQTQHTLRIVGFAGGFAALFSWWVQGFAAQRGFLVRMLFALFVFVVAFCCFGGLFRLVDSYVNRAGQQDWSLSGLYFASINDFYSFVLFMLVPPRAAYAALMVGAAVYMAAFGPRGPQTVEA